jgi:hypothetical protein
VQVNLLLPADAPFINLKKIKDHWSNILDPSIAFSPFSSEEDAWLTARVNEDGK